MLCGEWQAWGDTLNIQHPLQGANGLITQLHHSQVLPKHCRSNRIYVKAPEIKAIFIALTLNRQMHGWGSSGFGLLM